MQPAANIVASRSAPGDDFVVATAGTQIPRPAILTRGLRVDVAFLEPLLLQADVDAMRKVAHLTVSVPNKAMAGSQFAIGGNAEVPRARAARVWAVRTAVNLLQ